MKSKLLRVVEHVDEEYVLDVTRRLIRIPSTAPPLHLSEIAQFIAGELKSLGIEVMVEGDAGDGWDRPNVIASLGDPNGPRLMLAAHTDVVPPYDLSQWRYPPFSGEVVNGVLYGRGAADTKGSLGAMMGAVRAVVKSGISLPGTVQLVAWAGDEWHPRDAKWFDGLSYLAFTGKLRVEAGIFGEPYDLRICCSSRGRLWFRIKVGGESTHAATGKGINAILNAMKVIDTVYKVRVFEHPLLGKDTINVGTINGGVQTNIVPDQCELTFDIRFAPPRTTAEVEDEVRKGLEELRRDPNFILREVVVTERREPIEFPSEGALVRALQAAGQAIGRELSLGGAVSFGDIADWRDLVGLQEACLFGPGKTDQAHAINEHVSVDDLIQAAKIYAGAIVAYCSKVGVEETA